MFTDNMNKEFCAVPSQYALNFGQCLVNVPGFHMMLEKGGQSQLRWCVYWPVKAGSNQRELLLNRSSYLWSSLPRMTCLAPTMLSFQCQAKDPRHLTIFSSL